VIWADCRGGFAGSIVFADRVRFSGDTLESLKGKRVVVCRSEVLMQCRSDSVSHLHRDALDAVA
jgi:hypothetical protein